MHPKVIYHPHNDKKALRCIPTAKGFHNMEHISRKPEKITPLLSNPLVRRIKGNHAAVIKLLSKGLGRCRKALKLLAFLKKSYLIFESQAALFLCAFSFI